MRWNCLKVIKDVRLFFLKEMLFRCADKHENGEGKASNKQVNMRCLYDTFLRKCSFACGIIMNLECLHTHNVRQKGDSYYQLIDRQGTDPHIARETQCTHFWWKWIYLILKLQINHPQNCQSPFNKQISEYCHLQTDCVRTAPWTKYSPIEITTVGCAIVCFCNAHDGIYIKTFMELFMHAK